MSHQYQTENKENGKIAKSKISTSTRLSHSLYTKQSMLSKRWEYEC